MNENFSPEDLHRLQFGRYFARDTLGTAEVEEVVARIAELSQDVDKIVAIDWQSLFLQVLEEIKQGQNGKIDSVLHNGVLRGRNTEKVLAASLQEGEREGNLNLIECNKGGEMERGGENRIIEPTAKMIQALLQQ